MKWQKNTKHVTRKAWARKQLLRKVAEFGASTADKLSIYKTFVGSALEQSCTVWHSSLTKGNEKDLERVQKAAIRVITNNRYNSYGEALNTLGIDSLKKIREKLCTKFAQKSLLTNKTSKMFITNTKEHKMKLGTMNKYNTTKTKTERFKTSAIPYMEWLLNREHEARTKTSPGATTGAPNKIIVT